MPDTKQLDIIRAIQAQIAGALVADGYPYDLTDRVYIGRTEFGEDVEVPFVSILEAPRQEVTQPAEDSGLVRVTRLVLLIQGWAVNDTDNPTVPAYILKGVVEKRLARAEATKSGGGGAKYPAEYRLGGKISQMRIGPGVVRPPERNVSSKSFFYLPVTVDYREDLNEPFV
jgi:hypothetical protein